MAPTRGRLRARAARAGYTTGISTSETRGIRRVDRYADAITRSNPDLLRVLPRRARSSCRTQASTCDVWTAGAERSSDCDGCGRRARARPTAAAKGHGRFVLEAACAELSTADGVASASSCSSRARRARRRGGRYERADVARRPARRRLVRRRRRRGDGPRQAGRRPDRPVGARTRPRPHARRAADRPRGRHDPPGGPAPAGARNGASSLARPRSQRPGVRRALARPARDRGARRRRLRARPRPTTARGAPTRISRS